MRWLHDDELNVLEEMLAHTTQPPFLGEPLIVEVTFSDLSALIAEVRARRAGRCGHTSTATREGEVHEITTK